jgi:hypothetical protein
MIAARRRRLPIAMSLREAEDIAGRLGKPSKLPGYSYGLDARRCRRGGQMRGVPGSVCSTCYALNDFYATWTPVAKGHSKRHDGLEHPLWVDAMVTLIAHHCRPPNHYFRWHDSGDLQSPEHLERIIDVCRRTPDVRHWLPTREYADVAEVARRRMLPASMLGTIVDLIPALAAAAFPPNLVIRLSAEMVDSEPVVPMELSALPTSTVQTAAGLPSDRMPSGRSARQCLWSMPRVLGRARAQRELPAALREDAQ